MLEQQLFDFSGIDILSPSDDHILQAPFHGAVAPFIHGAEVTCVQPAFLVDGVCRRLRHFEVFVHHVITPSAVLAKRMGGHDLPRLGVDDLNFHAGHRAAQRIRLVLKGIVSPRHGCHR